MNYLIQRFVDVPLVAAEADEQLPAKMRQPTFLLSNNIHRRQGSVPKSRIVLVDEFLGYKDVLSLPLQRIVGYAEIEGVIKLDSENHLARLNEHWVVHPFNGEPLGAILRNVIAFEQPVACKGKRLFFSLPEETHAAISRQLGQIGIDAARDPSFVPKQSDNLASRDDRR